MSLWFAMTMLATVQASDDAQPQEIVVVARPRGCDVSLDDRILSSKEFDAQAKKWAAGKPVLVRAREDTDLKCLTRIAFRLAGRGVKLMQFVDPNGKPADPFPRGAGQGRLQTLQPASGGTSGDGDPNLREREWRFMETRAAKMVLDGQCDAARKMLLEAGDLNGAANVVAVCRQP